MPVQELRELLFQGRINGKRTKDSWGLDSRLFLATRNLEDQLKDASNAEIQEILDEITERRDSKNYTSWKVTKDKELNGQRYKDFGILVGALESYLVSEVPKEDLNEAARQEAISNYGEYEGQAKGSNGEVTVPSYGEVEKQRERLGKFEEAFAAFKNSHDLGQYAEELSVKDTLTNMAHYSKCLLDDIHFSNKYDKIKTEARNLALKIDSEIMQKAKEVNATYRPLTLGYQVNDMYKEGHKKFSLPDAGVAPITLEDRIIVPKKSGVKRFFSKIGEMLFGRELQPAYSS